MKNHTNELQNKKNNLWLKGIIALSLSIALQSDMCGGKSGGSNGAEIQDNNALYRAIKFQKDPKMVQDLLSDGMDCNHISRSASIEKKNSLLLALELKNKPIVEILLKQDKIDITRQDPNTKATPLHLAISNGWEDIAIQLINKLLGQDNNISLNGYTDPNGKIVTYQQIVLRNQLALSGLDNDKNTPLHLAMQKKLKKVVPQLIGNFPIGAFTLQDTKGRNIFHLAARSNNQSLLKELFKRIKSDKAIMHRILFAKDGKDNQGRTVFARAYLPEHANASVLSFNASDFKMFEHILTTTKDYLSKEDLTTIYNEIEQHSSRLKPDYKLKLQGIVSQGIVSQPSVKI